MMVERVAGLVEGDVLRQHHRQILVRHRHDAAFGQWITGIGQPQ
jgi:hypothetical protein